MNYCPSCDGPVGDVGTPPKLVAIADTYEAITARAYATGDYDMSEEIYKRSILRFLTGCVECGREPILLTQKSTYQGIIGWSDDSGRISQILDHNYKMGLRHGYSQARDLVAGTVYDIEELDAFPRYTLKKLLDKFENLAKDPFHV